MKALNSNKEKIKIIPQSFSLKKKIFFREPWTVNPEETLELT